MGIKVRHVVWISAALSMGAFIYVVTLEPMDEQRHPRAAAFDRNPTIRGMMSNVIAALTSEQHDNAVSKSQEMVGLFPKDIRSYFYLAIAHRQAGHAAEAEKIWTQMVNLLESGDESVGTDPNLYYYAWALRETEGLETSQQLFSQLADQYARASKDGDDRWGGHGAGDHYNLACYRAMGGEIDRAMEHWAFAVELGYGGDEQGRWWIVDPDLESLHEIDAFWVLGAQIGAPVRDQAETNPGAEAAQGGSEGG
tara:strand:- start:9697 stop:10455 length:759 start_codon:yes stop_codon:yes gene_type:complete